MRSRYMIKHLKHLQNLSIQANEHDLMVTFMLQVATGS